MEEQRSETGWYKGKRLKKPDDPIEEAKANLDKARTTRYSLAQVEAAGIKVEKEEEEQRPETKKERKARLKKIMKAAKQTSTIFRGGYFGDPTRGKWRTLGGWQTDKARNRPGRFSIFVAWVFVIMAGAFTLLMIAVLIFLFLTAPGGK